LIVLLAFAGPSFGQGRIEKGTPLADRIERVKKARVRTPQGETTLLRPVILDGGIASRIRASGDELKTGYNEASFISWDHVQEIRVRRSAAVVGALAGFGLGGLMGAGFAASLTAEEGASAGDILKGVGFLGLPGALLGGVLGSAITHWTRVYGAPSGRRPLMLASVVPLRRGGAALSLALSF
jgi:hypothetical protein